MSELVELTGQVSSIAGNAESAVINYQIPSGYVGEVVGVGVIPDYDPTTDTSNLDGTTIASGESTDRIGKKFDHSLFSTNHHGKNFLPYGTQACRQPFKYFDTPLRAGNLTYKFGKGRAIQIVCQARSSSTGTVKVRAKVFLMEEEEVRRTYGVPINQFATLPGGHNQQNPILLYAEYYDNSATAGNGKVEELASIGLEDFEMLNLTHIGVTPDPNADQLKLNDFRTNQDFPDRPPYWSITEQRSILPFGDDQDYQDMYELPSFIKGYTYTNTTLRIQIIDANAVVDAGDVRTQLLGVYKSGGG